MQPATRLVAGYLADRSLRCDDDIGFGDSAWRMPSSHRTRAIRLTCTQFARQQSFPSSVRSHLYHCPHFIFSTHVYRLHRSSPLSPFTHYTRIPAQAVCVEQRWQEQGTADVLPRRRAGTLTPSMYSPCRSVAEYSVLCYCTAVRVNMFSCKLWIWTLDRRVGCIPS